MSTSNAVKKDDTLIVKGYQLSRNFLRPHEGFGKTPAEACGINMEGYNKWLTLIQNVSHVPIVNRVLDVPKR